MKKKQMPSKVMTDKAVLLIPQPEDEGEPTPYGIEPGYYDLMQMLQLLDRHKGNADAIQFIADMLETGDTNHDGFVNLLRTNCRDAGAIGRIIQACNE